jgi:hypothetical protein
VVAFALGEKAMPEPGAEEVRIRMAAVIIVVITVA